MKVAMRNRLYSLGINVKVWLVVFEVPKPGLPRPVWYIPYVLFSMSA